LLHYDSVVGAVGADAVKQQQLAEAMLLHYKGGNEDGKGPFIEHGGYEWEAHTAIIAGLVEALETLRKRNNGRFPTKDRITQEVIIGTGEQPQWLLSLFSCYPSSAAVLISLLSLFHCYSYFSVVLIPLLSLFHCCPYFTAVLIPLLSLFRRCLYSTVVLISLISLFHWYRYFSGVLISLLSLFRCYSYFTALLIPLLSLFHCYAYYTVVFITLLS
jgi:hypothetical protein